MAIKSSLTDIDIKQIKLAIDVEEKHQYIDLKGKESTFSKFIKSEVKKIYKLTKKNPKWLPLIEGFEHYSQENIFQRKKLIKRLILLLKNELKPQEKTETESITTNKDVQEQDVTYLKGVGPKIAYLLNKINIFTVADLLNYFPKKHIDYSSRIFIKDLKESQNATVFGKITSIKAFTTRNKLTVLTIRITDETSFLDISFFYAKANRYLIERYKSQFPKDSTIVLSGKVKKDNYTGRLTIDKPQHQIINNDFYEKDNIHLGRIVPVYPLVENLSVKVLRRAIFNAITEYKYQLKNIIPDYIIEKYELLDRNEAIEQIHFPKDFETLEKARFTLVFEELFLLQIRLGMLKEENSKAFKTMPIRINKKGLVNKFIQGLPFELTNAQQSAVNEILNDINKDIPMQRLLQGDVGSGKTVVACIMLLAAIENNFQATLMAPTEILAQQHFNNLINWLTPLGLSVGLFTSSNSKKLRTKLETDLRNGQINIAVGTHALIQNNIEFNNLGAIVIDEQHRFGVKQRNVLKNKASIPQTLTMTATPIPRTLALTVHGDLDLTVIDELPKGRKPIKTAFITDNKKQQAYNLIRQQVELDKQAYIVFPLIDESETLSAKAATKEAEYLQNGEFSDLKIGLLHGKMKPEEKDKVMEDFKNKKYNILVSTTVVEVGVDVPNATVMVIDNAERFGLSQLHQLRGRVGRSNEQSYCILISSTSTKETKERLNILTQTNDGFVIAEKDLEIRGPGEVLGTRQSGIPELNLTDLTKDLYILEMAKKEATEFLSNKKVSNYKELSNNIKANQKLTTELVSLD